MSKAKEQLTQPEQRPKPLRIDTFEIATYEQQKLVFENRNHVRLLLPEARTDEAKQWLAVFARSGVCPPVDLTQDDAAYLVVR